MAGAGLVVGQRYCLVRPLGEGGMGSVWEAKHVVMGTAVAIKLISPELVRHPTIINRFKREARAAAKLRSPYVVQIFDQDIDPQFGPYIAMELLEGEDLATRLARESRMSPEQFESILYQICKGLTRAHSLGIVHRDLKPDNIFLVPDVDGPEIAKILDFGVAKASATVGLDAGQTAAGALIGTLAFMSPEAAQGLTVDHRTDLWALGVIAFQALTGRRPFEIEAPGALMVEICTGDIPVPSDVCPELPKAFDTWFRRATQRDPNLRYQSAAELSREFSLLCTATHRPWITADSGWGINSSPPALAGAPHPPVSNMPSPNAWNTPRGDPEQPSPDSEEVPTRQVPTLAAPASDQPAYYVMQGSNTVGPVSMDLLRKGIQAGKVLPHALVWTRPWNSWRRADEIMNDRGREDCETRTGQR